MATHHVRHLSHPSKKSQSAHPRPARPLSKRLHSQGKAAPKPPPSKEADLVCAADKHHDDDGDGDDDDDNDNQHDDQDSMAVSFLNYCTVCEKQIVVPSNALLYCSESCKRKDAEKTIYLYYNHYSPPTTPFAKLSVDDFAFRDIVPQRSPTQSDSKRTSCAYSDVSSDDTSDERYHSDASKYLRKLYSTPTPHCSRTSTWQYSSSAAPSLSHTPASSVSYSLPYTPATTRPLPPRTKSSRHGSYGGKSIDLVMPVTAPSSPKSYPHKSPAVSRTSVSTIQGEIVYAKSPVPEPSVASSSLGRLLASSPQHQASD